jgi:hypothetical protein
MQQRKRGKKTRQAGNDHQERHFKAWVAMLQQPPPDPVDFTLSLHPHFLRA